MKIRILAATLLSLALGQATAVAQQPTDNASKTQSIATADTGWQVICRSPGADRTKLNCSVVNETYTANDRVRLSSVEIVKGEKGRVMVISTPLGINLKDGIELQLDGAKVGQLAFSSCQNSACIASLELTDAVFANLKKGKTITVSFSDIQGSKLKTDISLTGLPVALSKAE